MTKSLFNIDALTAPTGDGQTLIQPPVGDMPPLIEANRQLRANTELLLLDRPAAEWSPDSSDESSPIIMTGHQPSFYHPGVWAKHQVATNLAARTGGTTRMLLVDSDVPHQLTIAWPDTSEPFCKVRTAGAGASAGQSYEYHRDRDQRDWQHMFQSIDRSWSTNSIDLLDTFITGFINPPLGAISHQQGYMARWMGGMAAIEIKLGGSVPEFLCISKLFSFASDSADPAAAAFTAHLLMNADSFVGIYNQSLADYRKRRGIRGHQHPIPDLADDGGRLEIPFWMVHPQQPRQRAFVSRAVSGELSLQAGELAIGRIDPAHLRRDPARALSEALGDWSIRPRALAQTMYARLLACDLFIHGIGGAKYDQITDAIIRTFFGVAPPAYGCVSATLRLDLPRFGVQPADLVQAQHKARDLRFNPQRYVTIDQNATGVYDGAAPGVRKGTAPNTPVGATPGPHDGVQPGINDNGGSESIHASIPNLKSLIAQRAEAIKLSRHLRAERRTDRTARKSAYEQIHQANAALIATIPDLRNKTNRHLAILNNQLTHDQIANAREWFFALYPPAKLQKLQASLKNAE